MSPWRTKKPDAQPSQPEVPAKSAPELPHLTPAKPPPLPSLVRCPVCGSMMQPGRCPVDGNEVKRG